MNHAHNNVHLLLAIIVSCIIITLLHVHVTAENNAHKEKPKTVQPITSLNAQDALDYIMPLLISGHIKGAADLIMHSNPTIRSQLIDLILEQQKASLSSYHKLMFLVALAHAYGSHQSKQYTIFNIIELYKDILPYPYTLLYATEYAYQNVLDLLLGWIKQRGPGSFAALLFKEGLKTIISENNVHALELLFQRTIHVTPNELNALLYEVIIQQKNPQFIPILIRAGGDINASDATSRTLLMHAVALNNLPLVKALLEEGADPNLIISPEIGSALQLALEKRFVPIELLLRQYGGKE